MSILSGTEQTRPRSLHAFLKSYRGWEYWNTFLFEFPAYLRLAFRLAKKRVGPRGLLKANWALDHGGFAFASKYAIQMTFPQERFLSTLLLQDNLSVEAKLARVNTWMIEREVPFPVVLKPDNGRTGMGVVRARNVEELKRTLELVEGDYLVQRLCSLPVEAGLFFCRLKGREFLLNLTIKELPSVVGDGIKTIAELIKLDNRLTRFSPLLSNQVDDSYVPLSGERVLLSYVGNHAQGAIFHNLALNNTQPLLGAVIEALGHHPGFNFGRLDVRAESLEALEVGSFTVIEVNGVDSLSINIFDPSYSLLDAYQRIFIQYDHLLDVAAEHKKAEMELLPLHKLLRVALCSERQLKRNQQRLIGAGVR